MKVSQDSNHHKSIQVKGMNDLSIPYIKRYFSYAGHVEDVKKLGESVIVKFKYHNNVINAHRFNGRIVDKQPIKIRNVSNVTEDFFRENERKCEDRKQSSSKVNKLKNSPLDLSKHWGMILKTLQEIKNQKLKWLISDLFCVKLEQIMHNYIYRSNVKAEFKEMRVKELILNIQNCPEPYVSKNNENVEILELKIDQPDKIQYQSSFYSWSNDLDIKIRTKFKSLSKNEKNLEQLRYLYNIMENNCFIIEQDAVILPNLLQTAFDRRKASENQGEKYEKIPDSKGKKISIENATQNKFSVKFKEEGTFKKSERCQFRKIDEEHPSKQIEVISDSHFHESPMITESYTFFKFPFDGCIGTGGTKHIFHEFLPYKSSNYILIRHQNMNRHKYARLQYSLRLLNCQDQVLRPEKYFKILSYIPENPQHQTLIELTQLKLAKHTLIIEDLSNPQKVFCMIKYYIRYILTKAEDYYQQNMKDFFIQSQFIVILVCGLQENQENCGKVFDLIYQRSNFFKKPKIFLICVTDDDQAIKRKCYNFLENYVDKIDGEMNEEIVKLRVQQLLDEKPHEIVELSHIQNYQEFIYESFWKLYLQKSKRKVKNNYKSFMFSVRK